MKRANWLRPLLFLALLCCLSYAKSWGGDGLWEISEGDHISSFNGFEVKLLKIGSHVANGTFIPDNATYLISWNRTPLHEATLVPGQGHNVSVNGTGRLKYYFLQVRLKELGLDQGLPFAETDVSSALFYDPPPPVLLSLNVSPLHDGAVLSWATSVPANATLVISGGAAPKNVTIKPRHPAHSVNVTGLAPDTGYSLNLTFCVASCNSSAENFTTLPAPPEPPPSPDAEADRGAPPSLHELAFLLVLPLLLIVIYLIHRRH